MDLDDTNQPEDLHANPAHKRPRSEPSSSDSHASAAGKGVTKIMTDWASPKIAEAAIKLHKRVAQLRKGIKSSKEAIAKLQELSAQEKTPSSLTLKLAPAAQKLLPSCPGAAEHIQQAQKGFVAEALKQRQLDELQERAELAGITSGDQLEHNARAATRFDSLTSDEQALVTPLILAGKEEFILTLHLSEFTIAAREDAEAAAAAKRATEKERRAMEMDQAPTYDILKRVAAEVVAKEMAKHLKQSRLDSRKKVTFESRQQSRSDSRGRSQSKGRSSSRNKDREKPRGKAKSSGKGGRSRDSSKPRGRAATPKPPRRRPSTSRSQSRENSRGGRGARPHRSPSAKRGGRERSVGGGGSKTGARR